MSGSPPARVALTAGLLDPGPLEAAARRPEAGAVCVFVGTVRSPNAGRMVLHLEYEAHEAMALARMERIVNEVESRPGCRAFLHHRLGRIRPGETSVVAVVSAGHRGEAFDACRRVIEELKHEVPIWKKEVFTDGSRWVAAPGEDGREA